MVLRCALKDQPRKCMEISKKKYLESLPKRFSRKLQEVVWNSESVRGKRMTQDGMKEYAALYRREMSDSDEVEDRALVLVKNAEKIEERRPKEKRYKDAQPRSSKEEMDDRSRSFQDNKAGSAHQNRGYRSRQWNNSGIKQKRSESRDRGTLMTCWFCGKPGHWARDCRYKNGLCAGCRDREHFVKECPRRQSSRNPPQSSGRNEMNGSAPNRNDDRSRQMESSESNRREQRRIKETSLSEDVKILLSRTYECAIYHT